MITLSELTPAMTHDDVRLPGGVRLRYARQGPRIGPAIILLHGYTDSSFSFSRVMPRLPPDLRVIALDQRGHGDSDRPDTGYSMDDFARDVVQAMDALEVPNAAVVGHSMGSFVARRVAALAPERVTRLVLIGSAASPCNAGMLELQRAVEAQGDTIDPAFAREFQESTIGEPVPADFLDRVVDECLKVPARVWSAALAGLIAFDPSKDRVGCPTLVLGGDRDSVFARAEQEALVSHLNGPTLAILPDVGHALHWEVPNRLVAALLSELGRDTVS